MHVIVPFVGGELDGSTAEFAQLPDSHLAACSSGNPTKSDYLLYLFDMGGLTVLVYVASGMSVEAALAVLNRRIAKGPIDAKALRIGPLHEAAATATHIGPDPVTAGENGIEATAQNERDDTLIL